MKPNNLILGLYLLIIGFLFSGCLKDHCSNTYKIYYPVFKTLSEVRAGMKSDLPQTISQTGKIYLYGDYLFLNEVDKGIHVIDNSNPANPKNISFIQIPGNVDMAVRGSYLYADSYSDLVIFDISQPASITAKKFVDNVFPHRRIYYNGSSGNPDLINVVVGYTEKDTVVDCDTYQRWYNCAVCMQADASGRVFSAAAAAPTGVGGSMARFAVVSDYLYTVSTTQLSSFTLSDALDPKLVHTKNLGWGIETIFPFQHKLFIGSENGMFIFDITDAAKPALLSQFSHVRSCDPVVADENFAYVTLRSGTECQGFTNQLEVLNITDLTRPVLLRTYPMTNPHGLSKDGTLLFICDGKDGLKIYNASDVNNLRLIKTINGLETYDVIAQNKNAIVVAKDGLYQFNYSDTARIRQISRISIAK